MTLKYRRVAYCSAFLALLAFSSATVSGVCSDDESPAEIIRYFATAQRRGLGGFGNCGALAAYEVRDRAEAKKLVSKGAPAAAVIETALKSLVKNGPASPASRNQWLLYSYAKIEGPNAYPLLQKLSDRSDLSLPPNSAGMAIALALGLSSYITPAYAPNVLHECSSDEPRNAMDALIVGWITGEQFYLERSIGPNARAVWRNLLEGTSWSGLRTQYWHGTPPDTAAIGYRFEIPGPWAEPLETLEQREGRNLGEDLDDPEIAVTFKDAAGRDCGRHLVRFSSGRSRVLESSVPAIRRGRPHYVVDSKDIEKILRTISSCASVP